MRNLALSLLLAVALLATAARAPLQADSTTAVATIYVAVVDPGVVTQDGNHYSTQGEVLHGTINFLRGPASLGEIGSVTVVANSDTVRDLQTGRIKGTLVGQFTIMTGTGAILTGTVEGRVGGTLIQRVVDRGAWEVTGSNVGLTGEGHWSLTLGPVFDQAGNLLTYAGPGQFSGKLKTKD